MSAITTPGQTWAENRPRTAFGRIAWTVIIFMALYFFLKAAFHYFFLTQESYGPYWAHRGGLLLHICGGTISLFLGPLQFWSGLRRKYLRFHRWTGRLYLAGVVIGAAGAFYLAFHSVVGPAFSIPLMMLGLMWVLSSAIALVTILRGKVAVHREWVTRSYVLTFAFVIFRLLADSPFLTGIGSVKERLITIAWLCWTIPLLITELILQRKRSARETSNVW